MTISNETILYHYTDAYGFLEIIKNGSLWASDIRYLNDSSELVLAHNILSRVVRESAGCFKDDARRRTVLDRFEAAYARLLWKAQVYIASFSLDGDQLGQWRAYGGYNSGFAIGFKFEALQRLIATLHPGVHCEAQFSEVEYDSNRHADLVRHAIEPSLARLGGCESDSEFEEIYTDLIWRFSSVASLIKNQSFEQEKESRLVVRPYGGSKQSALSFRVGRSCIVPYIELSFKNIAAPISMIVVGPTPHLELARHSTEQLCRAHGYDCEVIRSDIPFRNW